MQKLGSYLREEREKQGKSLNVIAEKTRISRTTLQAIESGKEELLPPASYLRGLTRLYIQELGLNEHEILARLPQQDAGQSRLAPLGEIDIEPSKKPLKIGLAVIIVCIVCAWGGYMLLDFTPVKSSVPFTTPALIPEEADAPPAPRADTNAAKPELNTKLPATETQPALIQTPATKMQPAAKDEPAAEAADEIIQSTEMPPAEPERFMVRFFARGIVWIELQADDNSAHDITLRSGESYRTSAAKILRVRLGNPALVDVWYNDDAVPLPGRPGIPLDVVFPDIVRQTTPDTQ